MLRSASCSGSKQTGLCIFFYENVNVMSNLENWITHNTCTMETPNSFKEQQNEFNKRKQFKWGACLHCIIHLPPPVALWTSLSLRSDNAAQFAWPSDHRDYNSSLSPDVIVVKCLLVLLLLQILNAYSFSHSCLPYSSNCFRGAWIQKTPEEFKNENTILIRIASWSSLETNLLNSFSLSLSSGRKWFYWRVKKYMQFWTAS